MCKNGAVTLKICLGINKVEEYREEGKIKSNSWSAVMTQIQ